VFLSVLRSVSDRAVVEGCQNSARTSCRHTHTHSAAAGNKHSSNTCICMRACSSAVSMRLHRSLCLTYVLH
jgi:hypothetical protein